MEIISCLIFFLLFSCVESHSDHKEHKDQESKGLISLQSPTVDNTISATFVHPFGKKNDTLFTAPVSIVNLKNGGESNATYLIYVATGEELSNFSQRVIGQIEKGNWPTSVTITVTSEYTYANALAKMQDRKIEINGFSNYTYNFASGESIISGMLPARLLIREVPPEYLPVPTTEEVAWHWNIFDCHSHWGIGSTLCHCKTTTCCPVNEKCLCDPIFKKAKCTNNVWCYCM